jgi:hypothetical protein
MKNKKVYHENYESLAERLVFNGTVLFFLAVLFLAFLISSCCASQQPVSYQPQDIPELEMVPVGTSFAVFDTEGKATVISKLEHDRYSIDTEQEKPEPQQGSFINIQVQKDKSKTYQDSYNKDKSESTTNQADNGATIGKDKSDNKGAEGSGNKSVKRQGWPVSVQIIAVILVILCGAAFAYFKYLNPLNKLK